MKEKLDEIKKLSADLTTKQTKVRKLLKNFLTEWKKATSEDLKDRSLIFEPVYTDKENDVWLLIRGDDSIKYVCSYSLNNKTITEVIQEARKLIVESVNFVDVINFIQNLQKSLEKYVRRLELRNKKCDELIDLLEKFGG